MKDIRLEPTKPFTIEFSFDQLMKDAGFRANIPRWFYSCIDRLTCDSCFTLGSGLPFERVERIITNEKHNS